MKENDVATNKILPIYPDLEGKIAVDASSWITGIALDIAGGRFIFY
jgi:hypothetical protein